MSRLHPARLATVRVAASPDDPAAGSRLATALLAGSPRVAAVGPAQARVDARGWERLGGEPALARTLRRAARAAGFERVGIGVADVAVASDAAAVLASAGRNGDGTGEEGRDADETWVRIVAPGRARQFLGPLPLAALPLPADLAETFRALGFRRVSDVANRPAEEFEARFGPAGLQAHRLACGIDQRAFRALPPADVPEAALELDTPADTLEPLLFVLRHLLARLCGELAGGGRCAARLELELRMARGSEFAIAVPARPTSREHLLYDLCRAALERATGAEGSLAQPVEELSLRVVRLASPDARQEDLFTRRWRDPLAAAAALSRLRVRLGEEAVVQPGVRADHRPESRSVWTPVEIGGPERALPVGANVGEKGIAEARSSIPGVLHLLPDPCSLRVRIEAGRPAEMWGEAGHRVIVAAEGPERLSGDWWKDPYHREYFRICTDDGEVMWLFREYRPSGEFHWWLHGWWD